MNTKIRSEAHRKYIASLDCLISRYWDETVIDHHLLRAGGKATGTRACDSLCIPLRSFNHDRLHTNGNEVVFLANNGWPYLEVLYWLKDVNSRSPDKRIRKATAVDSAIELYKRLEI
jgi:hypothetical protein